MASIRTTADALPQPKFAAEQELKALRCTAKSTNTRRAVSVQSDHLENSVGV